MADEFNRQLHAVTGWKLSGGSGGIQLVRVKRLAGVPDQQEGYRLTISSSAVVLQAAHRAGLRYGLQSLMALGRASGTQWRIPAGEISDWPDFCWRGFLVDPARKFIPMPRLRQYVDWLAQNKMNVLHMHLTDNEGFTVESRRFPELNERPYHPMLSRLVARAFSLKELQAFDRAQSGIYRQAEIRTLVAYAAERGVRIVPEISMPSHCAAILRAFPELKCRMRPGLTHGRQVTSDTVLCIGNEKTYQVLGKILDDVLPLFPDPVVHTGGDEVDCRDILYCGNIPFYAQRWTDCVVCQARLRQLGFTRAQDLFYYFIRRLHKMLARHGKRLMMWNDYIDIARPVNLPRDILIHYWQIAMLHRGPRQGCSFVKFLKAGFDMVNSHCWDTYIDADVLMQEQKLLRWNPAARPRVPPEYRRQMLGGELCAWGNWEHYPRTLQPGLAVFGDRVWNSRPVSAVPDFGRAVAGHLFGPGQAPQFYDLFSKFGAIIPPRQNGVRVFTDPAKFTLPASAARTRADGRRLAAVLQAALRRRRVRNRPFLGELLKSAQGIGKRR